MKILVVGASGATGKLVVEQLLGRGEKVKVIVRSTKNLPDSWSRNDQLQIVSASISKLNESDMMEHITDHDAVICCLGHNLSLKGMYGHPRRLVTDATRLICNAIIKGKSIKPIKFILMNTAGNSNRDLKEPISFLQKIVVGLIRLLLPPHPDNEQAADYLRTEIGQSSNDIEWVAVRPDSLINEDIVTDYEAHPSPIRSAIFNPGKTSRINVGHFMATLVCNHVVWNKWKGQMPVIYNK